MRRLDRITNTNRGQSMEPSNTTAVVEAVPDALALSHLLSQQKWSFLETAHLAPTTHNLAATLAMTLDNTDKFKNWNSTGNTFFQWGALCFTVPLQTWNSIRSWC